MLSIEVGSNFAAWIFIECIAAGTALPDALLRNPEGRFMAKGPGGEAVVETLNCGSCTDIYDNTVGIVQPLATARRDALAPERYRPKITRRFIIGNSCPLSRIGSLEASSTGKAEGASSKAVSQPIRHHKEALAAARIGLDASKEGASLMTEFSPPLSTGSSRAALNAHPVHRATALLKEALHESRRATFTQEFGEVRGIHRLSSPAEVFVDLNEMTDLVSPPTNLAFVGAYLGRPQTGSESTVQDGPDSGLPIANLEDTVPNHAAEKQLRDLIKDFKERQRRAGLIVAGSITAAITLTFLAIALLFVAAATDGATVHESVDLEGPARDLAATPLPGA